MKRGYRISEGGRILSLSPPPFFFVCVCVLFCVWYNRHYITVAIINWLGNNRIHSILHGISRPSRPHPLRTSNNCSSFLLVPPFYFFPFCVCCVCVSIVHTYYIVACIISSLILSFLFSLFLSFLLFFQYIHTHKETHTEHIHTHTHTYNNDVVIIT